MSKDDRDAKLDELSTVVKKWVDVETGRLRAEVDWLKSIQKVVSEGESRAASLATEQKVQVGKFDSYLKDLSSVG